MAERSRMTDCHSARAWNVLLASCLLLAHTGCGADEVGVADFVRVDAEGAGDTGVIDAVGLDVRLDDGVAPVDGPTTDSLAAKDAGCSTPQQCAATLDLPEGGCQQPSCDDGACKAVAKPDNTPCDDSNACTQGEACAAGKCGAGVALDCDDGTICTTDGCDPKTGCAHAPVIASSCDDGDPCTGADACAQGKCVGLAEASTLDCDDGNPCTDDSCAAGKGCSNTNNTKPCDDGNGCTSQETCLDGKCALGPLDGKLCECLEDAHCTGFEDGKFCNGTLVCDGQTHKCAVDPATVKSAACDLAQAVTCHDVVCTELADGATCTDVNLPAGATCSDGDVCTTGDGCASGSCKGAGKQGCDDGQVCTDDSCDPIKGCVFAANAAGCEDGDKCSGPDKCLGGQCASGAKLACQDGHACTTDGCVPSTGCVHLTDATQCDDGKQCTANDCVVGKGCVATPLKAGSVCSDGDQCTEKDACAAGACVPGAELKCAVANPCVKASCDKVKGCVQTQLPAGTPCGEGKACAGGLCVSSPCAADPQTVPVVVVAGGGKAGVLNGKATEVDLVSPTAVAVDGQGRVWIGDTSTVRRMDTQGVVTTIAGTIGGKALSFVADIALVSDKEALVSESGAHRIRRVLENGTLSVVAGSTSGFVDGLAAQARFNNPRGLAWAGGGDLIIADSANNRIRRLSKAGVVSTVAGGSAQGSADGPGAQARFKFPWDVAVDAKGLIFVADTYNQLIRRIDAGGVVTTVAGHSGWGTTIDGVGLAAFLSMPSALIATNGGRVWFGQHPGHALRRLLPNGAVHTLQAAPSAFKGAAGLAVDGTGALLVADALGGLVRRVAAGSIACEDFNPCTVTTCDKDKGCLSAPAKIGTTCDSMTQCIATGKCVDGACDKSSEASCPVLGVSSAKYAHCVVGQGCVGASVPAGLPCFGGVIQGGECKQGLDRDHDGLLDAEDPCPTIWNPDSDKLRGASSCPKWDPSGTDKAWTKSAALGIGAPDQPSEQSAVQRTREPIEVPLLNGQMDASMVGYWKLDGDGTDALGGKNGSQTGGQATSGAFGDANGAIVFEAKDDEVTVPGLDGHGAGAFTAMVWLSRAGGCLTHALAKGSATSGATGWRLGLAGNCFAEADVTIGGKTVTLKGTDGQVQSKWQHLALVRDDAGRLMLYKNGQLQASALGPKGSVATTAPLRIAPKTSDPMASTRRLDDALLFNRALSPSELEIYAQSQAPWGSTFVPGAQPDFDDVRVTEANDVQDGERGTHQELIGARPHSDTELAGVVGYWRLDGNAVDVTGNHPGTLNGAKTAEGRFGDTAGALLLDGKSAWVAVPAHAALRPTAALTVQAWILLGPPSPSPQVLVSCAENAGYKLEINAQGKLSAAVRVGFEDVVATSPAPIAADRWVHVAMTFDGQALTAFADGLPVAVAEKKGAINYSVPMPLFIGADPQLSGKPQFFAGARIDEVLVHDVALSADKLMKRARGLPRLRFFAHTRAVPEAAGGYKLHTYKLHWSNASAKAPQTKLVALDGKQVCDALLSPCVGLAGWWRLDELAGATLIDESSERRHMAVTGGLDQVQMIPGRQRAALERTEMVQVHTLRVIEQPLLTATMEVQVGGLDAWAAYTYAAPMKMTSDGQAEMRLGLTQTTIGNSKFHFESPVGGESTWGNGALLVWSKLLTGWYALAGVRGVHHVTLQVNSSPEKTMLKGASSATGHVHLGDGSGIGNKTYAFAGWLDEARLTDRPLSVDETLHYPPLLHGLKAVPVGKSCDDGNSCTADTLDALSGKCLHAPSNGDGCDDGSVCTLSDACKAGQCVAGPPKLFDKSFGWKGDEIGSVVAHAGGNLLVAGRTTSKGSGGIDGLLLRMTPNGTLLEERQLGGPKDDWFDDIFVEPGGAYTLVGATHSKGAGGSDGWVIRVDSAGKVVYDEALGSSGTDTLFGVAGWADGSTIVVGTRGTGGCSNDGWAIRFAPDGQQSWEMTYNTSCDLFRAAAPLASGEAYIAGARNDSAAQQAGWLVRIDAGGKLKWQQYYKGVGNGFEDLHIAADGGLALVGATAVGGGGGSDVWLVRTDADGKLLWQRSYGGAKDDWANKMAPMVDGGWLITAKGDAVSPNALFAVLRVDKLGNLMWQFKEGSKFAAGGVAMPDGGAVAVGGADSPDAGAQVRVVRFDAFGNVDCTAAGSCAWKKVADCSDSNPCTTDVCDAKNGGCHHVTVVDGSPCSSGTCQSGVCL